MELNIKLMLGMVVAFASGCVERRIVYVPTYQSQPGMAPAPAGSAPPGTTNAPPNTVLVSQAPPPPQVEVVTVALGPEYYWAPGYWGWNGGWVWIGGNWVIRPRVGAIWVGGRWVRHGRESK